MYHPKHKKSLYERLCNSIIDDELSSLDLALYMTYYDEEELKWIKANDPKYRPFEYYEDEIVLVPLLVFVVLLISAIWLCWNISVPSVK